MRRNQDIVRDLIDHWAGAQPDRFFLIRPETGNGLTFKDLQEKACHLCGQFHRIDLAHTSLTKSEITAITAAMPSNHRAFQPSSKRDPSNAGAPTWSGESLASFGSGGTCSRICLARKLDHSAPAILLPITRAKREGKDASAHRVVTAVGTNGQKIAPRDASLPNLQRARSPNKI
jgi:hypothetical protein